MEGSDKIFFFQAENGIRDYDVTGVQTCALPISPSTDMPTPSSMGTGAITATPSISTTIVSPGYVDYGMVLTFDSTAVSCYGDADGSASVVASCGIPPFTYSWSPGGSTNDSISGLSAGIYLVQVTDAVGTVALDSVEVTEPSVLTGGAMMIMENECDSICTGVAESMPGGGNGGYTYAWDNGAGNQTTSEADSLCLGTFFITVTDSKGCIDSIVVIITQPNILNLTITDSTDVSCNGVCDGSVTGLVTGGTLPYSWGWPPGNGTLFTDSTEVYKPCKLPSIYKFI